MTDICGIGCEGRDLLRNWLRACGRARRSGRRVLFGYQPPAERRAPQFFPRRSRLSEPRSDHPPLRAGTAQIQSWLMRPSPVPVGIRPGELRPHDRVWAGDKLIGDPDKRREPAELGTLKPDPDAAPCGNPGDHQQANPLRRVEVYWRRVFQSPVRVRYIVDAHPDALVGDTEQDAATVQQLA